MRVPVGVAAALELEDVLVPALVLDDEGDEEELEEEEELVAELLDEVDVFAALEPELDEEVVAAGTAVALAALVLVPG